VESIATSLYAACFVQNMHSNRTKILKSCYGRANQKGVLAATAKQVLHLYKRNMTKRHKIKSRDDTMNRHCARGSTVLISFHRPARVTTDEFVILYSTCRKTLGQHPHCIIHKHPYTHITRKFLQETKHCEVQ